MSRCRESRCIPKRLRAKGTEYASQLAVIAEQHAVDIARDCGHHDLLPVFVESFSSSDCMRISVRGNGIKRLGWRRLVPDCFHGIR
jgi:hypothetical protein